MAYIISLKTPKIPKTPTKERVQPTKKPQGKRNRTLYVGRVQKNLMGMDESIKPKYKFAQFWSKRCKCGFGQKSFALRKSCPENTNCGKISEQKKFI